MSLKIYYNIVIDNTEKRKLNYVIALNLSTSYQGLSSSYPIEQQGGTVGKKSGHKVGFFRLRLYLNFRN